MFDWIYDWTNRNPNWDKETKAHNVDIIAGYFLDKGWTLEAICGMLGNMEDEGLFNPAQWQIGHPIEDPREHNDTGFGLVQWTPWQKYASWCEQNGYDWRNNYDYELDRIQFEVDYGLQWDNNRPYHPYPYTFAEYTQLQEDLETMTEMFFWCYEYGTWFYSRITNAYYWWNYLTDNPPPPPSPTPVYTQRNTMNIMFYLKSKSKRGY